MLQQDQLIQNRYRVVRLLGSGGFGSVYQAEDTRLGRVVALKEMDAARLDPDERAIAEQLFEHEARTLAALDHSGLTRIWDYFEDERRAYLVMEYVPGQTLRELLRKRGRPLDEDFALECGRQLCDVLAYLHGRNPPIIFRDLKPANVMVVDEDEAATPQLVLIDFGIARFFKPGQVGDTVVIGTPGYAPPEQYGRGQTDPRSDIYSLGATLFHILTGQTPTSVPPPPVTSVNPAVSAEFAQVITRATALEPDERYPRIEDMRRDLLDIIRSRAPKVAPQVRRSAPIPAANPRATTPLSAPQTAPRRPNSKPMGAAVIAAAVLAIVLLGGAAMFFLSSRTAQRVAEPNTPVPKPTAPPANQEWLLPGATGTLLFGERGANGGFDIWSTRLDGTPPQKLTDNRSTYAPALAPGRTRSAVTRDENGVSTVYVGNPTNVLGSRISLPNNREARYSAWSPDGDRLAMVTREANGPWQLTIVNLTNGALTIVQSPANVGGIAWSPGNTIALAAAPEGRSAQDLFVLDSAGNARNITNTPDVEEDLPAWSPDARRIAFVASPAGAQNLRERQIFVANADGSDRTQLTSGNGPHANPVWSPDGIWIAYVAQENSADWQLWAMHADGSEPRQISFGTERKFYLSWAM